MITGKGTRDGGGYPYAGRPAEKFYLYEIISNKLTGNNKCAIQTITLRSSF